MAIKHKLFRRDAGRLEALGREGLSDRSVAGLMGMSIEDLRRELKRHPALRRRLERGRAEHERALLSHLRDLMRKTKNPTPAIVLGKVAHKWVDNPRPEPAAVSNVTVVVPAALSEAEYRRRVEARVEPKEIEGEVAADA